MGEIVSGVATAVLDKLATKAYQEISLACGLKGDIERLGNSMRIISAFLMDAENKQAKNHGISEWLKQLKDAFDDATDILDEIEYEAKRNEVVKMYGSASRKVRRFFSCSNPLAFRIKMAHKIKDIKERIGEITTDGKNLGLAEQHANYVTPIQNLSWRETGSFVPPRVSGRVEEKENIISLLISPPTPSQSQVSNIDVIPIVGIGGLGKTTLAQMVYNDDRVKEHFDMLMWVCVSDEDEFDVKGLILKIIKAADRTKIDVDHNSSLNDLQSLLREKLHGKSILLVLDDVWNANATKWDDLRNNLLGAVGKMKAKESKIIVTTRIHNVALIMGTIPQINLESLPEEECWDLFVKCAFLAEEKEAEQYPRLKDIGKEIVRKCRGLPLAVATLGCLLRSKLHDENEWKKISDSELWKIDQNDDGILPALKLSYNHLPSQLKQCFSYCSIFPKDYAYNNFELIPFWMAHGLLQPTNEKEEPEYLGELYIKQLVSASLFQVDTTHEQRIEKMIGITGLKMHDLVHDLAKSTMQSEREVRHFSIPKNGDGVHSPFPIKLNKLRTIGCWHQVQETKTITELSIKWFSNEFKYLRVLDLSDSDIRLLPADCFAKMKHLRYLNLAHCDKLEKLPDSICKLQLLQNLILFECEELQELPKNMRNLINLRNLYITVGVTNLSSINIGCFKFLQSLMLLECTNLVSLPRDMGRLTALKKLMILDCKELASFEDEGKEEEEGKQNDLNLQLFVIVGSPGLTALPSWLKRSADTLQHMIIQYTGLTALPEWLPNLTTLETLYIKDPPELIARCEKHTGVDWPKIAHVPHLVIDDIDY